MNFNFRTLLTLTVVAMSWLFCFALSNTALAAGHCEDPDLSFTTANETTHLDEHTCNSALNNLKLKCPTDIYTIQPCTAPCELYVTKTGTYTQGKCEKKTAYVSQGGNSPTETTYWKLTPPSCEPAQAVCAQRWNDNDNPSKDTENWNCSETSASDCSGTCSKQCRLSIFKAKYRCQGGSQTVKDKLKGAGIKAFNKKYGAPSSEPNSPPYPCCEYSETQLPPGVVCGSTPIGYDEQTCTEYQEDDPGAVITTTIRRGCYCNKTYIPAGLDY